MKKIILFLLIPFYSFGQHLSGTDVRLSNGSAATAGTTNGTIYFDTGTGTFMFRQGNAWVAFGAAAWGSITGTLSNQTDLQAALDSKQNIFSSQSQNLFYASPNGSSGIPLFRSIVSVDIPTLNQNTTGSAATLTTPRAIYGNNFDGSAALTQIIASTYGGTGNGFTKFSGPTTSEKTFTLPNSNATLLYDGISGSTINSPIINGTTSGTGVSTSSSASTLSLRDANGNLTTSNFLNGYTTTATAASTTTLSVASTYYQYFTGTTTQTVVLPVTSTFTQTGHGYYFQNNSTGTVTVQSSGSNVLQAMTANSILIVQCVSLSGTGTASWNWNYYPPNPMTTVGDMIVGGTVSGGYAIPSRIAASTSGYVLTSNGPGVAPSWQVGGGLSGLTTNGVPIATSASTIGTVSDLNYSARTLFLGLNSGGNNILYLGSTSAASNLNVNVSTGEFKIGAVASHFLTFYTNGANKRLNISTAGNFTTNSTASEVFRTTNGGSDVNAHFMIDPANSLTSGQAWGFESSNGFVGTLANGTRRILGASVNLTDKTTTAGSETNSLSLYVKPAGSAITQRLVLMGKETALTESTATAFSRIALSSGQYCGGNITVTIQANDGTDFQARTMRFAYTAVNKAGTITVTIETPVEIVAASAGTLTCTITAVDSGSGNLDFKANAVSSLTQTSLQAQCFVANNYLGTISAQ